MDGTPSPRILILSANPEDQRTLQEMLKPLNAVSEVAFTPLDFIQILLGREFDVAVVDIARPAFNPRLMAGAQTIQPWLQWLTFGNSNAAAANPPDFLRFNAVTRLIAPLCGADVRNQALDALRRKKLTMETPMRLPLNHILFLLEKIREILQIMMLAGETPHLLDYLRDMVSRIVASEAGGVFDATGNPMKLNLKTYQPVRRSFLQQLEKEILLTYEAFTGKPVARNAVIVGNESDISFSAPAGELGSLFIIPLVSNQQMHGILAFAAVKPGAYTGAETSYLCHFSNYFTGVFPGLRQIQNRAIRDELTGLFNRRYFEDELKRAWRMSRRYNYPVGLLMLDLDGFKPLNDNYGHMVGDAVLRELARLLESVVRRTDILTRYGGDEFAVILPNSNAVQTKAFARRVSNAVNKHLFCEDRYPLQIGVSIGAASNANPAITMETELVLFADRALYLSKENGKGKISMAEEIDRPAAAKSSRDAPAIAAPPAPAMAGQLLIIDDEISICRVFEQMLSLKGFAVLTETSPRKALELIRTMPNQIDVALVDLKMPEMNGIEVLEAVRRIAPDVVCIITTGYAALDNSIAALRSGAYDFIRKPVNFDELTFAIQRAVERRRLLRQVEDYRRQLEESLDERTRSLRQTSDALEESYLAIMEALAAALKVPETDTGEHDYRVAECAVLLGRRLKLREDQLLKIRRGALLHDIGKIGIPDAILQKAGPLEDAERKVMREHSVIGYHIVKRVPFLQSEAEMIYQHHERYDGTGYPLGLGDTDISLGARLFAVVDAFDALRSDRVYRKAVALEEAVAEIKRGSGAQFDPGMVEVFLSCYGELEHLRKISAERALKEREFL